MNKKIKIIIVIFAMISTLFSLIGGVMLYNWNNPRLYLKDFNSVSEDYNMIVELLKGYYSSEEYIGPIYFDIDRSDYAILYEGNSINMTEDESSSLRRVCQTSYSGKYSMIWMSETEIIFWEDETKKYAIMYTSNYRKSRNDIKNWYDGVEFKKINSHWYEMGYFGL